MSLSRPPEQIPRVTLALLLPVIAVLSACTDDFGQRISLARWQQETAKIYDSIQAVPGTDDSPPMLSQAMPQVAIGQPYQTAVALTELGPDAQENMAASDWAAVTDRLRKAAEDARLVADQRNAGPPAYTIWEMAWADRMLGLFTPHQRDTLLHSAHSLSSDSDTDPNIYITYISASAYIMLDGLTVDVRNQASAMLENLAESCQAFGEDDLTLTLAMAALQPIPSPCTVGETDAAWQTIATDLLAKTDRTTHFDGSVNTFNLLLLEESRSALWPDDPSRAQAVRKILSNIASATATTDTPGWLVSPLQKTAFLTGEEIHISDQMRSYAVKMAVSGSEPMLEQLRGASMTMGFTAARSVGVTTAVSAEFEATLDQLELLAVAYGQDDVVGGRLEQWITDLSRKPVYSSVDQTARLNVIAPILLTVPKTVACASEGISVVRSALGDNGGLDLQPSAAALGIRVLDNCESPVPKSWRDQLLASAKALASAGSSDSDLDSIWESARIQCALDPKAAKVGSETWRDLHKYAYHEGGAINPAGFVSLRSTYQLLAIGTTTSKDCISTGLLEARPT